MTWDDNQHAAGASKARYKIVRYLRANGIYIRGSATNPPEDHDFLVGIQKYAEWYTKKHPKTVYVKQSVDQPSDKASIVDRLKGLLIRLRS